MSDNQANKIFLRKVDNPILNHREPRPNSTKNKFNPNKINILINSLKVPYNIHNLRYSLDKGKFNKNETKLAKILLSNDTKFSLKIHKNSRKTQNLEAEINKNLNEDKLKIQNLEERIKIQRKKIEEKKNQIKNINQNNIKIKESIKEKENNIETIKKNINDYKKLNEEIIKKIEDINIQRNNNELNDNNINDLNDLDFNFDNSRDREDAINYLLSMMNNVPNQQYPNVDNMTYEELLELEERIGKVNNGLTEDEIRHLKQERFIKYKYLEDKCIICQFDFKELENIVVLPCKHCFHFPCIKPWITKEHYCPLCKINIRKEDK